MGQNNSTPLDKSIDNKKYKFGSYKDSKENPRPGYFITPSEVFYRGEPIRGVTPSAFMKLGNSWAKDKNNVYFQGRVISEADPKTFRVENKFGRDKRNKFYRGKIVK